MLKDYHVVRKVGEGSYGKVYMAQSKKTSKVVAVKHMDNFAGQEHKLVKVLRELKIMR